jgi:CheY-like chemotaxis protein
VFDMFRQGDTGLNRRSRGLGIGLALARRIVELHGGHIKAQSAGAGQGSTFRVSLPRATIRPEASAATARSTGVALAKLRVLIVDDDNDSRELLGIVLEHEGAVVELANSAGEALELLRARTFDVVVSDVGMPEMDGLALLRTLRQRAPEQGGRVPAIALTAYNRTTDRASTLHAGFDAHVPKPVDTAAIIAVIAELARR